MEGALRQRWVTNDVGSVRLHADHRVEVLKPRALRERGAFDLFLEKVEFVEDEEEVLVAESLMCDDALEHALARLHLVRSNAVDVFIVLIVIG